MCIRDRGIFGRGGFAEQAANFLEIGGFVFPDDVELEADDVHGAHDAGPMEEVNCTGGQLKPVSYTHLDVYKRQGAKRREGKKGKRLSFTWLNRGTSGLVSGFLGKDVWLDGDCTHIGEEGQRGAVFEEGWEVE